MNPVSEDPGTVQGNEPQCDVSLYYNRRFKTEL